MTDEHCMHPDFLDPVLDEDLVLGIAGEDVPRAQGITGITEKGSMTRIYELDQDLILKVHRPPQGRPRTSLKREVLILNRLADELPEIPVPRVLGPGGAHLLMQSRGTQRFSGAYRGGERVSLRE